MRRAGWVTLGSRPGPALSWGKLPARGHSRSSSVRSFSALPLGEAPKENKGSHSGGHQVPAGPRSDLPFNLSHPYGNITRFLPRVLQREGFERLQNPERFPVRREHQGLNVFYLVKKRWGK